MRAAYAVSTLADSSSAVEEAVKLALERLGTTELVVGAMCFFGGNHDAKAIALGLREHLPNAATIGCSTDGEISTDGLSIDSVSIMVFASSKIRAQATAIAPLSHGSIETGRQLATQLNDPTARALFLFPDGLTGNGSAIIRGALDVLGSQFVVAGGTAGDRGRFVQTWQICNGEAFTDSVVGMMLYSDEPIQIGFGVMSGWRPMGIAKEVTHAVENTVYRIEDATALEVYSSFLGDKASQLPAIGVEYPFALVDQSGRVDERGMREGEEYILLRAPMQVDRSTGAVTFAAEIPQGAKIKMTRAKSDEIIEGAREAAERALRHLGAKPEVVFFFSCMARKMVLGRKTNREISVAREVFGPDVPMIGFYTYGEIANCGNAHPICRFHNETATFLVIREP